MEPSPESFSKVVKFARATGDLRTLSTVDLKLIALTYTLEAQAHGTKNLRDVPLPIQTVRVKRLHDKQLPGWGSNVANLEEWEALGKETTEEKSNSNSKILPLKDLNINIVPSDNCPEAGSVVTHAEHQEEAEQGGKGKHRRYPPKKTEIQHEGKMVVEGVDASQGQDEDENSAVWTEKVSRSSRRRKARREHYSALAEQEIQRDQEADQEGPEETDVEATLISGSSEQSRSLSESSVACITGDYAMQNVILQMGLRLLAPGGMQIRELKRWILKCHACHKEKPDIREDHACYTVTPDIREMFCPKCGNGGTLHKVAVTISDNGITVVAGKPRFTRRGTKFSIPMPKGGRHGITKNMVLREDQLSRKFFRPKTKKKASKPGDEYFVPDDVFLSHHSDKKAPFQPPLRKSMAVFSQKRNPNDNHYSPSMH